MGLGWLWGVGQMVTQGALKPQGSLGAAAGFGVP